MEMEILDKLTAIESKVDLILKILELASSTKNDSKAEEDILKQFASKIGVENEIDIGISLNKLIDENYEELLM